ncbi:MAG: NAD(P)/FAD-dependent oxidoreductase [Qipengyuania sp.]
MREFDVLVIGGGIAGLSAAARLTRHARVCVLEGEAALGFHASGRSAAFAHFSMDDELVRRLTAASMPCFRQPPMDDRTPPARTHPAMFVARGEEIGALEAHEDIHRRLAPGYRRLSSAEAQEIVPVLRADAVAGALLDPNAMKLDSDAMLQGNRRDLAAAGGELVLGARVEALGRDGGGGGVGGGGSGGGRWIAQTAAGNFAAPVLINAAGAWGDALARLAGLRPLGLTPLRRTVITFDAPEGHETANWPFTKTVGQGFYFEPEGAGRLLACPMDETASEPCDAQPEEEDIALAAWRIEQATTMQVLRMASKWAGLRTFARDRLPVAGFASDAPGFFWLAGQGGFGLQTSPAMALAVEALVTGGDWPEELAERGVTAEDLSPARLR